MENVSFKSNLSNFNNERNNNNNINNYNNRVKMATNTFNDALEQNIINLEEDSEMKEINGNNVNDMMQHQINDNDLHYKRSLIINECKKEMDFLPITTLEVISNKSAVEVFINWNHHESKDFGHQLILKHNIEQMMRAHNKIIKENDTKWPINKLKFAFRLLRPWKEIRDALKKEKIIIRNHKNGYNKLIESQSNDILRLRVAKAIYYNRVKLVFENVTENEIPDNIDLNLINLQINKKNTKSSDLDDIRNNLYTCEICGDLQCRKFACKEYNNIKNRITNEQNCNETDAKKQIGKMCINCGKPGGHGPGIKCTEPTYCKYCDTYGHSNNKSIECPFFNGISILMRLYRTPYEANQAVSDEKMRIDTRDLRWEPDQTWIPQKNKNNARVFDSILNQYHLIKYLVTKDDFGVLEETYRNELSNRVETRWNDNDDIQSINSLLSEPLRTNKLEFELAEFQNNPYNNISEYYKNNNYINLKDININNIKNTNTYSAEKTYNYIWNQLDKNNINDNDIDIETGTNTEEQIKKTNRIICKNIKKTKINKRIKYIPRDIKNNNLNLSKERKDAIILHSNTFKNTDSNAKKNNNIYGIKYGTKLNNIELVKHKNNFKFKQIKNKEPKIVYEKDHNYKKYQFNNHIKTHRKIKNKKNEIIILNPNNSDTSEEEYYGTRKKSIKCNDNYLSDNYNSDNYNSDEGYNAEMEQRDVELENEIASFTLQQQIRETQNNNNNNQQTAKQSTVDEKNDIVTTNKKLEEKKKSESDDEKEDTTELGVSRFNKLLKNIQRRLKNNKDLRDHDWKFIINNWNTLKQNEKNSFRRDFKELCENTIKINKFINESVENELNDEQIKLSIELCAKYPGLKSTMNKKIRNNNECKSLKIFMNVHNISHKQLQTWFKLNQKETNNRNGMSNEDWKNLIRLKNRIKFAIIKSDLFDKYDTFIKHYNKTTITRSELIQLRLIYNKINNGHQNEFNINSLIKLHKKWNKYLHNINFEPIDYYDIISQFKLTKEANLEVSKKLHLAVDVEIRIKQKDNNITLNKEPSPQELNIHMIMFSRCNFLIFNNNIDWDFGFNINEINNEKFLKTYISRYNNSMENKQKQSTNDTSSEHESDNDIGDQLIKETETKGNEETIIIPSSQPSIDNRIQTQSQNNNNIPNFKENDDIINEINNNDINNINKNYTELKHIANEKNNNRDKNSEFKSGNNLINNTIINNNNGLFGENQGIMDDQNIKTNKKMTKIIPVENQPPINQTTTQQPQITNTVQSTSMIQTTKTTTPNTNNQQLNHQQNHKSNKDQNNGS